MITDELLHSVLRMLADGNAQRPRIDLALREAFPGVMFSVCSDNDIPSRIRPLASGAGFALYGISTGGHCATLVADVDSADGLTVALIDDDD